VGRLIPEKGHATLIDALAMLTDDQSWRAVFVGDGPERRTIEDRVAHVGLVGRIHCVGSVDDAEHVFRALDVAVLPSISEGLPIAMLEAMAHALPVLASRVGGIPEVLTNGMTGLLVDPGKPAQLASALSRLLRDASLRRTLGDNARQLVARDYSFSSVVDRLMTVYAQQSGMSQRSVTYA
jgi:glycosyltransferase involved in cell wall biosynthesis